jgi:hypothetical protein
VLADLLDWWPGRYDTLPQVDLERRLGAPPDGEHDRQYRVFQRVDVPHIGANVIYGQVHAGGENGDIVPGQQVLYILSIDERRRAVNVSGRRILNGPQYQLADLTPEKLKTIAIDPEMGGNCHFLWRRHGEQLVAHLSDLEADTTTCTMVSKRSGQKMTWDAEWVLTPDELWVFDNGYLHDKDHPARTPRLFAGREDRSFERMYKGRDRRCQVQATEQKAITANLHDRGGELALPATFSIEKLTLQLLRSDYARANGVGLVSRWRLAMMSPSSDEPLAHTLANADARSIRLSYAGVSATCRL